MNGILAKENGGDYKFVIENNTVSLPIGPPGKFSKVQ